MRVLMTCQTTGVQRLAYADEIELYKRMGWTDGLQERQEETLETVQEALTPKKRGRPPKVRNGADELR